MALITSANAREMAAKSHESILLRNKLREERWNAPPPEEIKCDEYIVKRVMRVRAQLDRIDRMMMEEDNPQAIDRLAAAMARLSEQERILAGRPLPGSHRPSKPRSTKAGSEPVTPE
jgi:hypothetical protein